jgi:RNA polymerase sigma factor (TIGR02999 family)
MYRELRRIAASQLRRERTRGTLLDTTVLVHEAWLRLGDNPAEPGRWDSRAHFFGSAANAMRRILVDNARRRVRRRRAVREMAYRTGPDLRPDAPEPADLIALDEALTALEARDPRAARIVTLRYFGGLSMPDVAYAAGVSLRTAEREWAHARAWLAQRIAPAPDPEP